MVDADEELNSSLADAVIGIVESGPPGMGFGVEPDGAGHVMAVAIDQGCERHLYDDDMSDDPALKATRSSYDATASLYARSVGTEINETVEAALDRSLLSDFARLFSHGGLVGDLGCGPGRAAAFLASMGAEVVGIDLSFGMVEIGHGAHPDLSFAVGDLAALPIADHSLAGAVCWYSIIHTEPERLDAVFDEIARVLVPAGSVLLAFQAGSGERVNRSDVQGTPVALTNHRHDPNDIFQRTEGAGFEVRSCVVRERELAHESTAQAFVTAQLRSIG